MCARERSARIERERLAAAEAAFYKENAENGLEVVPCEEFLTRKYRYQYQHEESGGIDSIYGHERYACDHPKDLADYLEKEDKVKNKKLIADLKAIQTTEFGSFYVGPKPIHPKYNTYTDYQSRYNATVVHGFRVVKSFLNHLLRETVSFHC